MGKKEKRIRTKKERLLRGFVIGISVAGGTIFVGLVVVLYLFFAGPPAKKTEDVTKYQEIFTESNVHTGYLVFPEEIPESARDIQYYHYFRDTWNAATVQTFLQCTYDTDTYEKEVQRLENTSKTYSTRTETLHGDTEGKYQYPAYIAVENAAHTYEYALLTGENQITYIFTQFVEANKVAFDQAYLPKDYMTEEGRAFGSGYSIYYMECSEELISSDYTREAYVPITGRHYKEIDDDWFAVEYEVDREGREIITGCSYNEFVSYEEDCLETVYTECNGKEYVALALDREKEVFTVTYLEDGEEKTISYQRPASKK